MSAPELTVGLPSFGTALGGDWRRLLDLARDAEDAGVDRIILTDHVIMGPNTHEYTWGRFPVPPDAPWLEPLGVLTGVAAVTERIRLSTGILVAPLRPAILLAKQAATLDVLSGGRLDLGVGTGWQREEFEAEGLDFDARGRLLTDTVAACRALWEDHEVHVDTTSVTIDGLYSEPKPVQRPLPVWFSGSAHARNVERIVRLGNGWLPIMGSTSDDIREGVGRMRDALRGAGRDPDQLHVTAPPVYARADDGSVDLPATLESVPELVAAGVTNVRVELRAVDPECEAPRRALDAVVGQFRSVAPG